MDRPRQRTDPGINGFPIHPPTTSVRRRILDQLHEIESDHDVRILWAVESGSRAWGFASPDSDYDARFVYVHRTEWYLSIHEGRDVIELPLQGNLDISGWDLRKALRLFCKSNPVLMEWITSPLKYLQRGTFASRLRTLAQNGYSRRAAAYHYLHMAEGNYRAYLAGKQQVNRKKYLYVLRPLVAILWLRERDGLPPMSFLETLNAVNLNRTTRAAIDRLLEAKATTSELGTGRPIPVIDRFLAKTLKDAKTYAESAPVSRPELEQVDDLFRSVLREAWR